MCTTLRIFAQQESVLHVTKSYANRKKECKTSIYLQQETMQFVEREQKRRDLPSFSSTLEAIINAYRERAARSDD